MGASFEKALNTSYYHMTYLILKLIKIGFTQLLDQQKEQLKLLHLQKNHPLFNLIIFHYKYKINETLYNLNLIKVKLYNLFLFLNILIFPKII